MLDLIIVVVFLMLVLAVGLYKGRNIKSMVQYSVGSRNFSTPILVATIFATFIGGGSTIGMAQRVYSVGIIFIIAALAMPINKLVVAKLIAPRLNRFRKMISVGDMMQSFYGKEAKIATGIAGTISTVGYVGAQIIALGYMGHMLTNIPFQWCIIFGATIIVIYSTFGGVESVTATDVVQFAALIIAIPTVCGIALQKVGGYSALFAALPDTHKTIGNDSSTLFKYLSLFVFWLIPFLDPSFVQRLLMSRNNKQVVDSMYASALISIPFFIMVGLIGLIALVLYPNINSNLAFPTLISEILPIGFKGIVVAGMFSVIMSTADSDLNACSITFVHDIVQPLRSKPLTDKQELFLAKIVTAVVGFSAILAALFYKNIIDLVLAAASLWVSAILAPLLLGILGYKASSRTFFICSAAGMITFFLSNYYLEPAFGIDALFPSILVNAITFFFLSSKRAPEEEVSECINKEV